MDRQKMEMELAAAEFSRRRAAMEAVVDPRSLGWEWLVRQLEENPYSEVREWAADQLGRLGRPEAVDALCRALEDPRNHARMIRVVVREGDFAYMESAPDRDVQTAIIQALVRLGSAAVGCLQRVAASENPQVRAVAQWGLYRLGEGAAESFSPP